MRDRLTLILEAGLSLRCQQGFWLQRALCLEAWRRLAAVEGARAFTDAGDASPGPYCHLVSALHCQLLSFPRGVHSDVAVSYCQLPPK